MPRLDKVLVANRGEIAVRVIRALRETGRRAVAVYSEADADALHVRLADEAVCLGPPPPGQSYLDVQKVIAAARRTGAQGVHPGYGFISERAPAARAVEEAGLVWIGPSPAATAKLDDKIEARKVAQEAGVPTIPGSTGAVSKDEARALARSIGLPVLLKAAGGGGGKGIRLVRAFDTLEQDLERAAGEAQSAFGTGVVYLEKCISPARHIEVLVLGDGRGKATPSLALSAEVRAAICKAAVAVVERVQYRGAGTVEFLLDAEQRFYFLEVNKRLQVEHPITEMVTGVDLVRAQLEIAETGRLPLSQDDWRPRGHAIELRVNAEDPWGNFAPSVGRVAGLRLPSGPFVRVDTALVEGAEVTPYYDSLLAKLIVWGRDREEALSRWATAAQAFHLGGVRTTLPLAPLLAEDEEFRRARFDTEWLVPWLARAGRGPALRDEEVEAAALAAALLAHRGQRRAVGGGEGGAGTSPWVLLGRREQLH
jgi:acetyl-CoA carboxylase biotin carboxylase subunit